MLGAYENMDKFLNRKSKLEIIERIDHLETISLLGDMVRISTENPPGNEEPLCLYLKKKCESLGLETKIIYSTGKRPSLFAKFAGKQDGPYIFFNGHLDTVPCGDRSNWTVDPYGSVVKNGKLFGRGACDMKSALASMITAIETVVNSGFRLKTSWAFEL